MTETEELYRLAHDWEKQAEACDQVRLYGLGDEAESLALLNRSKAFEHCARSLRSLATSLYDPIQVSSSKPVSKRKS